MLYPLLKTKLYLPPPRPNLVPRSHLVERLNQAFAHELTLISASAGFGKTTMLQEWISECDLTVAWISIDRGDNDVARFWTYVLAAIQTIKPETGKTVFSALQTPQPPPIRSLLIELINEISDRAESTTSQSWLLVLDDYHLITESMVHDSLIFFLDHLPPKMHLIISSRFDPPWPLARLRARRTMMEIRAEDLRFSHQEVVTFLNAIMKFGLSTEDVVALGRQTEGWIVGLQMAALSMLNQSDLSGFIRAFTGTNRFILDYLLEEVLDHQSTDVQEFLLKTSLLDQMTAPLCDSVLERSNSRIMLSRLEQANLFLVPLDDQREWYRYHHLFSELLRNQLTLIYPDEISVIHQRASQWLEDQGFVDEPVAHALAAKDYWRVARLCVKYAQSLLQQSKYSVLSKWIETLPADMVRQSAWLCVYQSWTRHWSGQREGGEECLENAERILMDSTFQDQSEKKLLGGSIATVRAHYALVNEQLPLAIDQAEKAWRLLPKTDFYTLGTAGVALGGAYWAQGDVAKAEQVFVECASTALKGGFSFRASSALCYAAVQQVTQAKLALAETTLHRALSLAQGPGDQKYPNAGYPLVKLGELACEWNDLVQARNFVEDGVKLCEILGHVDLLTEAYAAQAKVQLACGDYAGTRATLQLADQISINTKLDPWATAWLDDCRVRLWLSTGHLNHANRWIAAPGLNVVGEFSYHYDLNHITLARVLAAQIFQKSVDANLDQCLELLARLLAATNEKGWKHHKIQVLILQALVLSTTHDYDGALQTLHQALTIAEPGGYVRTFVSEGKIMKELLQKIAEQKKISDYVTFLLDSFLKEPISQRLGLIEPLSTREMEVMNLLITSLSVPEIADKMFLSPNTVRSHIKNIYGKLEVNRRMDAIEKAKELGLV
ncbi:MAG: LuxR C-terminal-related transcriptional regulator [Chloroflexota bacterium]